MARAARRGPAKSAPLRPEARGCPGPLARRARRHRLRLRLLRLARVLPMDLEPVGPGVEDDARAVEDLAGHQRPRDARLDLVLDVPPQGPRPVDGVIAGVRDE